MSDTIPYVIALYMRLSIEGSRTESMSIQNQRLALRKYVDSMEDVQNVQILEFSDDGYSGTNFERPAVQRLLDMIQQGKVNCVIVKDFTRFGRNSLQVGYYMERIFPVFRVRFISVNDGFDSGELVEDTGGLNMAFKYLMGELYSRDLSIKTKSAKYVRMRRGEYQSVICPYGYRKSADGRMEPDEETAPVVLLVFELASSGMNAQQIANALYERQIPTPGEYKVAKKQVQYDVSRTRRVWDNATVLRILADERYTGTYIMGKRRVTEVGGHHVRLKDESEWFKIPDHHPAIVSRELYEKANASIKRMKRKSSTSRTVHEYPLRKKVFCGCCRHALERMDTRNRYYRCSHSGIYQSEPCYGLRISEKDLEAKVYAAIVSRMEELTKKDNGADADSFDNGNGKQPDLSSRIAEYKNAKRLLYERYAMREISIEEYKTRKAEMDRALVQLENISAALSEEAERRRTAENKQAEHRKLAEVVRDAGGLTCGLSDAVIERVYYYPDNRLEIEWKA